MGRKRTLTREKVLEAAAQLANDAGGFEGITLKQVAAAVNVRVPSLYNHVDGVDDLRVGLRLLGVQRLYTALQAAVIGRAGADALLAVMHAYRTFAHQNVGLYTLTLAGDMENEQVQAAGERIIGLLLTLLAGMGITGDEALHTVRALRSVAHGFVSLETTGGFQMALDVDESYERLIMQFVSGLVTPS